MKWVTRERPVIDRIACPWLITRFIDKEAEFLFVPPERVIKTAQETGAVPYDVPGVEFTHVGEGCSFDAFVQKYELAKDPAIAHDRVHCARRRHRSARSDAAVRRPAGDLHGPARPVPRRPRSAAARVRDLRRALRLGLQAHRRDAQMAASHAGGLRGQAWIRLSPRSPSGRRLCTA